MFGPAPVLDFDGTIAKLDVDWVELRRRLKVERIDDLWLSKSSWEMVTNAEITAAAVASPVDLVVAKLSTVQCFSILTSNDAGAVHRFLDRFPDLKHRLRIVVGREELRGPKSDYAHFEAGLQECLAANGQPVNGERTVYVGDSPYELDFARRVGLGAIDVKDLLAN